MHSFALNYRDDLDLDRTKKRDTERALCSTKLDLLDESEYLMVPLLDQRSDPLPDQDGEDTVNPIKEWDDHGIDEKFRCRS